MSESPKTPSKHDKPRSPQPSGPTPEDPRQREPIHDPPVHPEQDIERDNPTRQARAKGAPGERGIEAPDPSPDEIVFDENRPLG